MDFVFARKVLPYRRIENLSIVHAGEQRIFLNESGTAIWGLLDGRRSCSDIAAVLADGTGAVGAGAASTTKCVALLISQCRFVGESAFAIASSSEIRPSR